MSTLLVLYALLSQKCPIETTPKIFGSTFSKQIKDTAVGLGFKLTMFHNKKLRSFLKKTSLIVNMATFANRELVTHKK